MTRTMESSWEAVYVHTPGFVPRDIAGEMILLPIRRHVSDLERIFVLDELGASIYRMTDGTTSLGQIRDALVEQYEVERGTLEGDLLTFTAQLASIGAIVLAEAFSRTRS